MPLTRAYEEPELPAEARRIYSDVRSSFDLPFVPSIFKLSAGVPDYLRVLWDDLGPVARSKEFRASGQALEELLRSTAIRGGWRFSHQQEVLAAQKFSQGDVELFGLIISTFVRAL